MRLGIDFGTTRIVVAAVDRGNYPVITFEDRDGANHDWFPPVVAARGGTRVYGWDAWQAQYEAGWTVVRSLKRVLDDAGPYTRVQIGDTAAPVIDILTEMAAALKRALLDASSLPSRRGDDTMEVMLGVPANANSNQRFLTVEPFVRAGFSVLGLLNEPSAASVEYGHRNRMAGSMDQVLVYDLGGGTFDASLVRIEERVHTVVATDGVHDLGGDDFDLVLSDLGMRAAGLDAEELTQAELFRLHEECRAKKEALHPNTRRVVVDLGQVRESWPEVTVQAAEFYEACRPLIERSIAVTEKLLAGRGEGARPDALYVTGGGSELPAVSRVLKEVFGRRVKRSAYTRSATAIGLAIQVDAQSGYVLREMFGRHFGVWREAEAGNVVSFDPLFGKGFTLPPPGEEAVTISRTYCPVHNIGRFRFLECSHVAPDGRPAGDIALWDEIAFPFDPALRDADLAHAMVAHASEVRGQQIHESYSVTPAGTIEVTIANLTSGYSREYRLARWAPTAEPAAVVRRRRARH